MKKITGLTVFVCVLLIIANSAVSGAAPAYAQAAGEAGAGIAEPAAVRLTLDGAEIYPDVPPIIENGRTLVPVRALFEALGGEVLWDGSVEPGTVYISKGGITITLAIGSNTALVNGAETQMDVPAQIFADRTLIPVRFVSETLSFTVTWSEPERLVGIYSPGVEPPRAPPQISSISAVDVSSSVLGTTVTITGSAAMADVKTGFLIEPSRFTLEVSHSALASSVSTASLEWQREISVVGGVTASQPAVNTTLFIFDLLEDVVPDVRTSPDQATLYLDFPKPAIAFDPWMDGKLSVILDPGHGAETAGKRSPD